MYHSGKFNITDTTSERLVVQIAPGIWERAWAQSGLPRHVWSGILSFWTLTPSRSGTSAVCWSGWPRPCISIKNTRYRTMLRGHRADFAYQPSCDPAAQCPAALGHQSARRQGGCLPSGQLHRPASDRGPAGKYTYTSREHLSRVFKEYTLESIHGYLTNLRMQHCRNELADGTGVLDACTASGFANYSSFLKSFRALYGITPAEYRAQLRQSRRTP